MMFLSRRTRMESESLTSSVEVGIRRGIQIENLLRDRIDLVGAEDVRLTVTCERPCWVAGIRLIEGDRL